jgi:hypothetical protein
VRPPSLPTCRVHAPSYSSGSAANTRARVSLGIEITLPKSLQAMIPNSPISRSSPPLLP